MAPSTGTHYNGNGNCDSRCAGNGNGNCRSAGNANSSRAEQAPGLKQPGLGLSGLRQRAEVFKQYERADSNQNDAARDLGALAGDQPQHPPQHHADGHHDKG